MLGGHVHAVFTLVTIIFIVCVSVTLNSFREMPLWKLEGQPTRPPDISVEEDEEAQENAAEAVEPTASDRLQPNTPNNQMNRTTSYGTLGDKGLDIPKTVTSDQLTHISNIYEQNFFPH